MKKFALVLISMFITIGVSAQKGVDFKDVDLRTARELSAKSGKPIFMDAYTTWCGPCKYMASRVFTREDVGDFINKNFIAVKYDMEKGEGPSIARDYGIQGYPTFLILDSDGKELARIMGSTSASEFMAKVKRVYPKAE